MRIDNKYDFGDEVYLKSDDEQLMRIVTGFLIRPGLNILYELSQGSETSNHYDFEISAEVNTAMQMGIKEKK